MMAYAQLFGRASKEVLFLLYAKPLRIHVFFLLFYVLCLGVIAGCAENDTANKTDYFNSGESTSDIEGIALDNGAVELYLDVDSDKIQVINDFLKTNTKRIVVTSSEIDESVEIELFLYRGLRDPSPLQSEREVPNLPHHPLPLRWPAPLLHLHILS